MALAGIPGGASPGGLSQPPGMGHPAQPPRMRSGASRRSESPGKRRKSQGCQDPEPARNGPRGGDVVVHLLLAGSGAVPQRVDVGRPGLVGLHPDEHGGPLAASSVPFAPGLDVGRRPHGGPDHLLGLKWLRSRRWPHERRPLGGRGGSELPDRGTGRSLCHRPLPALETQIPARGNDSHHPHPGGGVSGPVEGRIPGSLHGGRGRVLVATTVSSHGALRGDPPGRLPLHGTHAGKARYVGRLDGEPANRNLGDRPRRRFQALGNRNRNWLLARRHFLGQRALLGPGFPQHLGTSLCGMRNLRVPDAGNHLLASPPGATPALGGGDAGRPTRNLCRRDIPAPLNPAFPLDSLVTNQPNLHQAS